MEISCRVYRPRRPRESPLFQFFERHLEELLQLYLFLVLAADHLLNGN